MSLSYRSIAALVCRDLFTVFKKVIWNAILDFRSPLTLTAMETYILPNWLNGQCNHITCSESRNWIVYKTSDCTNRSTTFTVVWTVISATIASAAFDTTSQTDALLMACWTTKLESWKIWCRVFKRFLIFSKASCWSHPCLTSSWRAHVTKVHSTLSYIPIIDLLIAFHSCTNFNIQQCN